MNNGGGFTGTTEADVAASINGVTRAYNSLYDAINTTFQNSFVNAMKDLWACQNAINFFTEAKSQMDSIINSANAVFESVVNSMNSAATAFDSNFGNAVHVNIPISVKASTIDVSGILENIGGRRGIDLNSATSTTNSALESVRSGANSALSSAKSAVSSCGFLGGNMASNLQASLDQIATSINNVIESMTNASKDAINKTVEEFGVTEMNVSSAFAGTEG